MPEPINQAAYRSHDVTLHEICRSPATEAISVGIGYRPTLIGCKLCLKTLKFTAWDCLRMRRKSGTAVLLSRDDLRVLFFAEISSWWLPCTTVGIGSMDAVKMTAFNASRYDKPDKEDLSTRINVLARPEGLFACTPPPDIQHNNKNAIVALNDVTTCIWRHDLTFWHWTSFTHHSWRSTCK